MALYGSRYIQDDDPGVPPFGGFEWYKPSTGELYIRDSANAVWLLYGYGDSPYLGFVPVSGATMTGALDGVSGWAPQDSPDFTQNAKKDGIDLATKGDLSNLRREMLARFNTISAEILANASTTNIVKTNLAIKTGVSTFAANHTFTLPFPQYENGTGDSASRSEVIAHGAWLQEADVIGGEGTDALRITLTSDTTMTYELKSGYANGTNWGAGIKLGYIVVAVR